MQLTHIQREKRKKEKRKEKNPSLFDLENGESYEIGSKFAQLDRSYH